MSDLRVQAADWDEFRRLQDAQQRRYERAGVGGGRAEHDEYFGHGEYAGHGTEHRLTSQDWIRQSRQPSQDDLPPHEREWHRGYELGQDHGQNVDRADFAEMDREHAHSPHPEHFADGYSVGLNNNVPYGQHRVAAVEEGHPHELWQKRTFGVYHVSNGRRLPVHTAALILPQKEQDARADAVGREDHRVGDNAPFAQVRHLVEGARAYNHNAGLGDPHDIDYGNVRTNAHDLKDIGRAYEKLPDRDAKAIPSFQHMGHEVQQQYDHLTNRMGIKVHPVDYDPYKNVHEMVSDLRNNKQIKVLKTASTGSHPFFSDEDNDKFRAVHDAFGHAATGRGFDAHGEEAAFAAHSRMFSPHARPAMVSETRGQNAFLHLNGEFGDQKIAILPRHMHEMAHDLGQSRVARYAVLLGFGEMSDHASGVQKLARVIAEDMPRIVKLSHDSGDPEVVFHCPFCGSGQVIARSDGTIECGFDKACFTVQVQPRFPAFPQTINGVPMQVPGMGPQWPGDDDDDEAMAAQQQAQGTPVDPDDPDGDDDTNPFADDDADAEQEPADSDGGGNPFAKKSFRTAHGDGVPLPSFLRHVALEAARDRRKMLTRLKER